METTTCLVDCENFYVSCERAFDPRLRRHPVAVLSNNDGCIIARSHEVKHAGIPMGAPYFKYRERLDAIGAKVFSSNYALYADMSRRVMRLLEKTAVRMAAYSIDEAFLRYPALPPPELEDLGRRVRRRIRRAIGIPTRFGFGATKTLAKLANQLAKAEPDGVFALPTGEAREEVLAGFPVEEVWGIGAARTKLLYEHGVTTARELRNLPDRWVKKEMTITGLRTVWELRGTECLPLDEAPTNRRSLVRSRSFSRTAYDKAALAEAVATRTARAAEKLRTEALVTRGLQVFITTRFFGKGPHYENGAAARLPRPTSYTPELVRAAKTLLGRIYREGYAYKKAGVTCFDLRAEVPEQGHLFLKSNPRERALMAACDRINQRLGRSSVRLAASGLKQEWEMQRSMRSPRYTTRWSELPVAYA